jgi:hypothetical protein
LPILWVGSLGRRKHLLQVEGETDFIAAREFPAFEEGYGNGEIARAAVGGLPPGALDLSAKS